MKYTLLELTQEILSDMDSDEINTISDTAEAQQVARCLRQTYYNIIEDIDPPQHYVSFPLIAGGASQPTLMTLPDSITKLVWIKYNKIGLGESAPVYEEIYFKPKEEFFNGMYQLNTDEVTVGTFNLVTADITTPIIYKLDRAPTYYTTFDNSGTIIFDSIDTSVDDFLLGSKSICYGRKQIDFLLVDSFIPDLEEPMFTRLLNEAKVLAFAELKSVDHAIANRDAKRARNRSYNNKFRVPHMSEFNKLPSFGRK